MILDNLSLFLRIVEKGGLAAGGREMGLSPATVSERVAALEAHYGARLLNRTTRSISLTEEGRELVDGAQRLLAESDELEARIRLGVERIAGPVRVSAPSDLGRNRLAQIIDKFLEENPEVTVDLHLSDGFVDVSAAGFDLAIRYGDLADSSLVVRRLADNSRIVCAAPSYLERSGTPVHPIDLESHNCLLMRFGSDVDRAWPFAIDGGRQMVTVRGDRIANDGDLIRRWALEGRGVMRKSQWDVHQDICAGRLIPLLREFEVAPISLQAVMPAGRTQPRRVRALLASIVSNFSTAPKLT
ncbi:LysR family transcriptional regulator [Tritonibacter mobilis]|uniref:LysR family transcriptional regulator n=1 Tax=Tritonibacter mobilis F1926 TaxID=1265309 RepID=A0A1B1A765_9RHOB|nr:LysR family transcriptional regulator [Tritonibacter mobilis]ANP42377.1 LysR family transcriptional regulator [Tritonibacter mobilis F1926]KJZ22699.1 LysR family transcriptional regulator [Tritonibacter mobilis]